MFDVTVSLFFIVVIVILVIFVAVVEFFSPEAPHHELEDVRAPLPVPAPVCVPADFHSRTARAPVTWAAQATAEFLAALGSEFGTGAAARGPIRLPDFQAAARFAEDQNARRRGRRRERGGGK